MINHAYERQELTPGICGALGVTCGRCIQHQVDQLRSVTESISEKQAKRIFAELYPSRGCVPMKSSFIRLVTLQVVRKAVA